jgi:16S rRNA (guanine966-N2)-methyltransferase
VTVRVIAGAHRGRRLVTPAGEHVRPTKGIVREAVFSALDARGLLVDAHVLDLYSGSGALGIESLSRGAARAVLVERDRAALAAIRQNVAKLEIGSQVRVVNADVTRFLGGLPPVDAAPFGLVFADPPYETSDADVTTLLVALGRPGWLGEGAAVVVERPARHPVGLPAGWQTGWERGFGDTLTSFCFR